MQLSIDKLPFFQNKHVLCVGRWRPQNAYLKAAFAEHKGFGIDSDDEAGYSDLEDFIVCKPGRDYNVLIQDEFKYTPMSKGWCVDKCE